MHFTVAKTNRREAGYRVVKLPAGITAADAHIRAADMAWRVRSKPIIVTLHAYNDAGKLVASEDKTYKTPKNCEKICPK